MKILACISFYQSREVAHKSLHSVLFFWFLYLHCFGQLRALIFLCQSSHCWRQSLQMQNGTSDGLLFYLAAFSSVEMVRACVCARTHVCVYTFHYAPSRRDGAAFIFCQVIYDLLNTKAMATC